MDFAKLIQECAQQIGEAPRSFSIWDQFTYLRVSRPAWLTKSPNDGIHVVFRNLKNILAEGVVVWGHIVQANSLLFKHGTTDCPAAVLYSVAAPTKVGPAALGTIAQRMFSLKGTNPANPQERVIAKHLTDEMSRPFGLPVPRTLCSGVPCEMSTCMMFRKHLPTGKLTLPFFPLLVYPKSPRVVMVLPERYWPNELLQTWMLQ